MFNSSIRLHLPAIPYTITRDEFSHDAFTGKVMKFSPMMQSRGYEVYHYGVETSMSGANVDINLFSVAEWTELRVKTIETLLKKTREEALRINQDPTFCLNTISNWDSELSREFNVRLVTKLRQNYRSKSTDLVCLPLGRTHQGVSSKEFTVLEFGIGYGQSNREFRVFESHTWMASTLAEEKRQPCHYWFVIPHFFNITEFPCREEQLVRVGYMGRLTDLKGLRVIKDIAKYFPRVEFVICGQGDPSPFLDPQVPNLVYKKPIYGSERADFLGSCIAFLHPCLYLEPFGCAPVEAQLCGTPVICSDWGGMSETVEQFKSGLRCHTFNDFLCGIQMALDKKFDRAYVRTRAQGLYDMYTIAHHYEYVINTVLDLHKSGGGWYSSNHTSMKTLLNHSQEQNNKPRELELDMIYYINLDKRRDREEHIQKEFARANIPHHKITRFSAIDGESHTFTEQELNLFSKCSVRNTASGKKIMANQLSHYSIFHDMLHKGYKKILILQDDVVFREQFLDSLSNVCANLPTNCEIMNIGLHKVAYYDTFEAYDLTLPLEKDIKHVQKKQINQYCCEWNHSILPCSLSYILTELGATNLIRHFETQGFLWETDHNMDSYLKSKDIFYGSTQVLATGNPSLGTDIFNTEPWWSRTPRASSPRLTIVTPCCRQENLELIRNSIHFTHVYQWIIVYDPTKTYPKLKVFDNPKITELHIPLTHPWSKMGNSQRDYALNLIKEGWVYFLDDDNLMHPNFWIILPTIHTCEIFSKKNNQEKIPCFYTFDLEKFTEEDLYNKNYSFHDLKTKGQKEILTGNNCLGKIDTAMFLVEKSHIKDTKWSAIEDKRGGDRLFISTILKNNPGRHIYIPTVASYHNGIYF
jgi:glycosyltransferase involved in cell wall biosynthesis/GR25 family glycosyltransferase involved in LPS biosynthesis